MSPALVHLLIEASRTAIVSHAEELTALDRAIGDGDHGVNMRRGVEAVAAAADEIAALPFGKALEKAGVTLVMSVGGASGPLYGSLLMAMGRFGEAAPENAPAFATMLAAGVAAVKARGKSDAGAKTLLDVLIPVQKAVAVDGTCAAARAAADAGLAATRDMRASKGRAAFLGERSVGHLDPGARSAALLVHAVCNVLETAAEAA